MNWYMLRRYLIYKTDNVYILHTQVLGQASDVLTVLYMAICYSAVYVKGHARHPPALPQ